MVDAYRELPEQFKAEAAKPDNTLYPGKMWLATHKVPPSFPPPQEWYVGARTPKQYDTYLQKEKQSNEVLLPPPEYTTEERIQKRMDWANKFLDKSFPEIDPDIEKLTEDQIVQMKKQRTAPDYMKYIGIP